MKPLTPPGRLLGSKVVSNLGPKLYSDPRFALRELVQNAYDSINRYERLSIRGLVPPATDRKIEIIVDANTVDVLDKGTGMTEDEVWKFCSLGMNDKQLGLDAGVHGIGTYAGATIGTKLEVRTKTFEGKLLYGVIDFSVIFENDSKIGTADYVPTAEELVKKAVNVYEMPDQYRDEFHFTRVKVSLRDTPNVLFGDPTHTPSERQRKRQQQDAEAYLTSLNTFLGMYCPVGFSPSMDPILVNQITLGMSLTPAISNSIELLLNNEPVYKQDPAQHVTGVKVQTLKAKGTQRPVAQIWYGLHKKLQAIKDPWIRGIVLYKDGFAIDTPERKSVTAAFFKRQDLGYYFTGEVHLMDKNLIPNMERTSIPPSSAWEETAEALEEFFKPLDKSVRERSDAESVARKVEPIVQEGLSILSKGVSELAKRPSDIATLIVWNNKVEDTFKSRGLKLLTPDKKDRLQAVKARVESAIQLASSQADNPSERGHASGAGVGPTVAPSLSSTPENTTLRSPFLENPHVSSGAPSSPEGVSDATMSGDLVQSPRGLNSNTSEDVDSKSGALNGSSLPKQEESHYSITDTSAPLSSAVKVTLADVRAVVIRVIYKARQLETLTEAELAEEVVQSLFGGRHERS